MLFEELGLVLNPIVLMLRTVPSVEKGPVEDSRLVGLVSLLAGEFRSAHSTPQALEALVP